MAHADTDRLPGHRAANGPPAAPAAAAPIHDGRARWLWILLWTVLALAAWFAVIAWRQHRLTEAVRSLPPDVQATTYRRTYEELSTVCVREPTLADHCRRQAEFILEFPQCDAACRDLARRYFTTVWK